MTSLDGAWGKKQVWCPQVQTWGLSEANVSSWKNYLWHSWDFLASLRSHLAPPQQFGTWGIVPPLSHPWLKIPLPWEDASVWFFPSREQVWFLFCSSCVTDNFLKTLFPRFFFASCNKCKNVYLCIAELHLSNLNNHFSLWKEICEIQTNIVSLVFST